jgi:pimeloyl-ACP methyl ester carboxylesterase
MGGGLALDTALSAPARVAGLVLLAPAVSGTPEPTIDFVTMAMFEAAGEAAERGDLDEVNRLETWLWLDGPNAPEGRVSGPARELSLEMNRVVLANGVPEDAGDSGIDAWARIGEIDVPAITAWGDLDVPFLVARARELADRLPRGEHRVLHGMAHLPYLEDPATVAQIVTDALAG